MEKKLLLDVVLGARQLDEIKVRSGAGVEEFIFRDRSGPHSLSLGPIVLGEGQRFRLELSVEPVTALPPRLQAERWVSSASERLRSNLEQLRGVGPGFYLPCELDDLAASIDNLINARLARAMDIHEDADHDVDD